MAVNVTLNNITSGYNTDKINTNFTALQAALLESVSLAGTTPNAMVVDFDLNGNDILNVGNLTSLTTSLQFSWKGAWTTATAYLINDIVSESGNSYICVIAHTSGTFATDLVSVDWELLIEGNPSVDTIPIVKGSSDTTKLVRIEADGLTTATTRVITMPDVDVTLATPTELTKLSGIETAADVTNASNVGTAIVAATAKTTLVDADRIGIIDSAASNALKPVLWSTVRSEMLADNFTPSYTGGVARTLRSKIEEIISVTDFGAIGDGVTDDTVAFQTAANTGSNLTIPAGTYILTAAITFTGPVSIRGEGIGKTFLQWAGTNGFEFTGVVSNSKPVEISGMALTTTGVAAGDAINIDNSAQITGGSIQNRTSPRLAISNVHVRGATSVTTDSWLRGVNCLDVLHGVINDFHFEGKDASNVEGMRFNGTGNPVEIVISQCWVFHAAEGIHIEECEGVFISQCNLVDVDLGVKFTSTANQPQLNFVNNHVNANVMCLDVTKLSQGEISGNLFYARNTASANVIGVKLAASIYCNVRGNVFVNTSSYNFDTVVVTTNGVGCYIVDNIFQSASTAIWLQTGSTGVRVGRNVYGAVTNKVLDQSTATSYVAGAWSQANKTGTFVLANGSAYSAVAWDAASGSQTFWDAATPTRLTAKSAGRYKISGVIVFAVNATGERRLGIRKNGGTAVGYPQTSANGQSTTNATLSVGEVTVLLADNDYIELVVAQTSGASMTMPLAESSIKLEFVWED